MHYDTVIVLNGFLQSVVHSMHIKRMIYAIWIHLNVLISFPTDTSIAFNVNKNEERISRKVGH